MNKLLTRIAKGLLGLSMAVGVGVALAAGNSKAQPASAGEKTETLTVGTNGNTTWSNGVKTSSATVGDVTFTALGSGGNDGKYYSSDTSWRFYTSNSSGVRISVPSTYHITTVKLTWKTGAPKTPSNTTASGTTSPTTYTVNNTSTTSLDFVRNSSNFLLQKAEVTFTDGASSTKTATTIEGMPSATQEIDLHSDDKTLQLSATVKAGTVTVTSPAVTWGSSNTSVATVSGGLVTAKAVGSTTITASYAGNDTYKDCSAQVTVNVIDSYAAGSVNNPYSVADAKAALNQSTPINNVYVAGIISQIDSYNSNYHSITYWISDDGTTNNQFEVYGGLAKTGEQFNSKDDIEVGASVVIYGNIKIYNSVYEFDKNNTLISYTAPVHVEPTLSLNPSSIDVVISGSSVVVTASVESFTNTPTISVKETPSHVSCSVSGMEITFTGTSVGSETLTIRAVNGTEVAEKTIDVNVYAAHGHLPTDAYSVSDGLSIISELADTAKTPEAVYTSGVVASITEKNTTEGYATYIIKDNISDENGITVFKGKYLNGAAFTSQTEFVEGAEVIVYGQLQKYVKNNVTTPEICTPNQLYSYEVPVITLESITLSGTHKTTFEQNEAFSYEGLVVTAHYSNGSSSVVTPTSVSTPDMNTTGEKTVTVTYTEGEVSQTAQYNIQVNAPAAKYTVSFLHGEGSGTMDSVQVSEGEDYTLPACTFTAPEGKVFDHWEVDGVETTQLTNVTDDVEVVATWKDAPLEVTDVLNNANTVKATGTTYSNWTSTGFSSGAEYAGNSAGNHTSIQLRSNNSNSGVVSTTSGGVLKSITITFNSNTTSGRTISVYGSKSAYTAPTDLYGDKPGTLLGEANYSDGATQTINVTGNYEYVGIRSKADAMYIDSISIVWLSSATPEPVKTLSSIDVSGAKTDFTVGEAFVTTGLTVTAHYSDAEDETVTGYTVDSSNVDITTAGTYEVVVSYTVGEVTKTDSYNVTYSNPAPVEVATYKKVESDLADFSGDYLIVYEGGEDDNWAFDGSLSSLDAASNRVEVTISGDTIQLSEEHEFHIAAKEGGYSIQSKSGMYIGKTSDGNGMNSNQSDLYTNSISYSFGETNEMKIVAESKSVMRFNPTSGQTRFRFFSSSTYTNQSAISLYMQVDKAEAVALDILNLTSEACGADGEHTKANFESAWTSLETSYTALTTEERSELAGFTANAKGTMTAEAMARYELLVNKYGLDEFITGHTFSSARTAMFFNTSESNSSMAIIIVVSLVSISSLGILLVIKKRRVTQ